MMTRWKTSESNPAMHDWGWTSAYRAKRGIWVIRRVVYIGIRVFFLNLQGCRAFYFNSFDDLVNMSCFTGAYHLFLLQAKCVHKVIYMYVVL